MMDKLGKYIEEVHEETYHVLLNNCLLKHWRIMKKARELGHAASLMGCISTFPSSLLRGLPMIGPHFYATVDDRPVDVTYEPSLEKEVGANEDIPKLACLNLSQLRPHAPEAGPPVPRFLPEWPWRIAQGERREVLI